LLGIEIERDSQKRSISLCQHRYIMEVKTPMVPGARLEKALPLDAETTDKEHYMRAVGALMYLATSTRPDIAYTSTPFQPPFHPVSGKSPSLALSH